MTHAPAYRVIVAMVLLMAAPALAQAAAVPKGVSRELRERVSKAVTQLIAEARDLDKIEKPKHEPLFERPHPALKGIGLESMPLLVPVFLGKLTGNDYRDSYVRWHILEIFNKAPDEAHKKIAQQLVKVLEEIPGRLHVPRMPYGEWDNPELRNEYVKIVNGELRLVVGYPPHQKYVHAPASIELMPERNRARARQLWVYAQKLKDKFKWIPDPKGIAFNRRVDQVNYLAREYLGEMVYSLARSGEYRIVEAVIRQIDKHARQGSLSAYDMLNYLYQASFDGYFNHYSRSELKNFSKQLETTARATEGLWVKHGSYRRNFAHYSFHMIQSFKINDTMCIVSKAK